MEFRTGTKYHEIDGSTSVIIPACKIRCFGQLCFAAAGRLDSPSAGFDIWLLAEQELQRQGTVEQVSKRFDSVIERIVPSVVSAAKRETPKEYAGWTSGRPVLAWGFAGFEDGVPFIRALPVATKKEVMIGKKGDIVPREIELERGEADSVTSLLMGYAENIAVYERDNPGWATEAFPNPIRFAERLVRMEVEADRREHRNEVGEPVSSVSLRPNSPPMWQSIGDCK